MDCRSLPPPQREKGYNMTKSNVYSPKTWQQKALLKYYFNRPHWINGTSLFHQLIKNFIKPGSAILEVGAGTTNKTTAFLSTLGKVTGLDIDPEVRDNENCESAFVYDGINIPCETNSFDCIVSDYACEHFENPLELCREFHRVLRPGGLHIFRTPNLWYYVSLVARFTPHWIHNLLANWLRSLPSESHSPYPTFHRMNTKRACRSILEQAGFNVVTLEMIEKEPSYGLRSRFLFYPMLIWERLLNSSPIFQCFRSNILCVSSAEN